MSDWAASVEVDGNPKAIINALIKSFVKTDQLFFFIQFYCAFQMRSSKPCCLFVNFDISFVLTQHRSWPILLGTNFLKESRIKSAPKQQECVGVAVFGCNLRIWHWLLFCNSTLVRSRVIYHEWFIMMKGSVRLPLDSFTKSVSNLWPLGFELLLPANANISKMNHFPSNLNKTCICKRSVYQEIGRKFKWSCSSKGLMTHRVCEGHETLTLVKQKHNISAGFNQTAVKV